MERFEEVQPLPFQPLEQRDDTPRLESARPAVLVVEDDPGHREYLVELLSLWGYEPLPVGTGEEADFAVRRHKLHAAVVDVFLPGRSGPVVIARIRAKFPRCVVVGVSALGDATMARQCKAMGADLFISKPVPPEELARALQSEHESWH
jgi:CheY-like chemotaxis protein